MTAESGRGKTKLAGAVHHSSARAGRAFIELNCAALPDDLFESELFGAVPGGHSTATKRIPGKIEAADGGTLFLDEIGELSVRAQAKLLQVLQSGSYFPLGSASPRKADIRVIAATNADLASAVAARTFREDLYYRLNVYPIRVPSLSERRSDIGALAQYFSEQACQQNGIRPLRVSEGALMALQYRDWPGNVRELAHAVQAAALRAQSEGCTEIERRHLVSGAQVAAEIDPRPNFHEATRRFQASLLRDALTRENWNVAATARTLGLTRAHLYNLLAAYDNARPAATSSESL
jgi:Nif-specific regulatory protein